MDTCYLCLFIPLLVSISFDYVTSLDGAKLKEGKVSTVVVLVEGQTAAVSCASLLTSSKFNNVSGIFYFRWETQKDVPLKEAPPTRYDRFNVTNIIITNPLIINKPETTSKSGVESTSEGVLVFHVPRTSVAGQYSCRFISIITGQVIGFHNVQVKVAKHKSGHDDDAGFSAKIGLGLVVAAVLIILVSACAWRHYRKRKNKKKSKKAKPEKLNGGGKGLMTIPTITILNVYGEEVQEEIW